MDWTSVSKPVASCAPEPLLKLLDIAWRFVAPSTRILECGIYQTDAGFEVRVGYSGDDLLYSRQTFEIHTARETAAELRQAVLAKGGFSEAAVSP